MKKLLSLLLISVLLLALAPNAPAEEQAWDLQGNTVKVRLWDSPNPYDPEVTEVDKEKWLPVFEAAKEKYNVNFEFYSTSTQWDEMPNEWVLAVASGTPSWHITNNFSAMWVMQMVANNALQDVKTGLDTLKIPQPLKDMAVFSGLNVGFGTSFPTTEIIAFNRKMIKDAGMEYDPGEMFEMGKWSYDDFFAYVTELQSKLPEGSSAFLVDPEYWAIFAAPANGEMMVRPDFSLGMTNAPYMETMEFLQKLHAAQVMRAPNVREDGRYDYRGTASATFDAGVDVAMTHRAMWQIGPLNENRLDWGIVPYPWGSNVTLGSEGDYTTLSDNYRTAYYDMGVMGVMLAGIANDFPGLEKDYVIQALTNLTYDLFVDQETQERLAGEAEAAEAAEAEIDLGNFQDERSAILFHWLNQRTVFNPVSAINSAGLWSSPNVLDGRNVGLYGLNRAIIENNLPVRSTLEAAAVEVEAAFRDAGVLK